MKKIVYVALLLCVIACQNQDSTAIKQPNFVFVFADDMTFTALNALGNTEIITPNLDRLVNNGTTFTHAYNMGAWNGAVCAASRAMIISGRSVWDVNKYRQGWLENKNFDNTWGKLMEKAGYETYMTGKWHVDAPADSVFQNVAHVRPGMPRDSWSHKNTIPHINSMIKSGASEQELLAIGYNRPLNEKDTLWNATDHKFGGFWQGGKHWSEVVKDDALGFIKKAASSKHPFFMYLAFNAPHDPRQAPQEFLDLYDIENISVPESFIPMYPFKDSIGNGKSLRDEALAPFPRTEFAVKTHIKEYYALITHLDEQIGQIIKGLENSGKIDNTYIVFTADHGLAIGKHGLLGKQTQFDHSIRAPFMIVGPNIPKGKKIDADIYLQDVMPTSLELAGIKKPDHVFFNSLMSLIDGSRTESHYDAIYNGYINYQRMIRKDGFKLIVYPKINKLLLFDMENDPEEMTDLSELPEHQDRLKTMSKELLELQKKLNDPLDISSLLSQN